MTARLNLNPIFETCALPVLHVHLGLTAIPFDLAFPGWYGRMFRKGVSQIVKATLLAARTRIEYKDFHSLIGPLPIPDFRNIIPTLTDVLPMLDKLIAQQLLEVSIRPLQPRHSVYHITSQMIPVELIQHSHIEWRCRCSFFF